MLDEATVDDKPAAGSTTTRRQGRRWAAEGRKRAINQASEREDVATDCCCAWRCAKDSKTSTELLRPAIPRSPSLSLSFSGERTGGAERRSSSKAAERPRRAARERERERVSISGARAQRRARNWRRALSDSTVKSSRQSRARESIGEPTSGGENKLQKKR